MSFAGFFRTWAAAKQFLTWRTRWWAVAGVPEMVTYWLKYEVFTPKTIMNKERPIRKSYKNPSKTQRNRIKTGRDVFFGRPIKLFFGEHLRCRRFPWGVLAVPYAFRLTSYWAVLLLLLVVALSGVPGCPGSMGWVGLLHSESLNHKKLTNYYRNNFLPLISHPPSGGFLFKISWSTVWSTSISLKSKIVNQSTFVYSLT